MRLTEKDLFDSMISDLYSFKADIVLQSRHGDFIVSVNDWDISRKYEEDEVFNTAEKNGVFKAYKKVQDSIVEYIQAYKDTMYDLGEI